MSMIKDVAIASADVYIALNCESSEVDMDALATAISVLNEIQSDSDTSIVETVIANLADHTAMNSNALEYVMKNYKFFISTDTINRYMKLMDAMKDKDALKTETARLSQLESTNDASIIRSDMAAWEYVYISTLLKQCQRFNLFDAVVTIRNKLAAI